jgi:hypothetical protein
VLSAAIVIMPNQVDPNLQVNTSELDATNYVPNNKLAIVLDCPAGISAEECCEAIADIVPGTDMMFSSRLSGGRLCVFLRTEENVTKLTQEGGIIVRGNYVPTRRYVTQATKIVLSNVSPIISNEKLSKELAKLGKLASTIRNISNGYKRPDIAHILSFRRIVYLLVNKPDNIPETINIEHEDKNYLVFVSCDDILCYKCRGSGHIARNCKKVISQQVRFENARGSKKSTSYADTVANTNTDTPSTANSNTPVINDGKQSTTENEETTTLQVPKDIRTYEEETTAQPLSISLQHEPTEITLPKKKNKRKLTPDNNTDKEQEQNVKKLLEDGTLSQLISDSDSESISSIDSTVGVKADASESLTIRIEKFGHKRNKLIDQFTSRITTQPQYPLSISQFNRFLKETYGFTPRDILRWIKEYHTDDRKGIKTMIEENAHQVSNSNLTKKLKKIVNIIDSSKENTQIVDRNVNQVSKQDIK